LTFSNSNRAELIGLLDPAGLGLGFMLPMFSAARENARLIQRIDPDGRIAGFEVAEDQDTPLLQTGNRMLSLGDGALWGFGLDGTEIVDDEAGLRARLAEIIDEGGLRMRPMLGLEVATFGGPVRRPSVPPNDGGGS
jgi:hypothetical protein